MTQAQRLRQERKLVGRQTILERLHSPPAWWVKGKQLGTGSAAKSDRATIGQIEKILRDSEKNPTDWQGKLAINRLEKSFRYYAERSIRKYFELRPESGYSFEQIYSEMMKVTFPTLVKSTREKGYIKALGRILKRNLAIGNKENLIKNFEKSYLRKKELPGRFRLGRAQRYLLLEPEKLAKYPYGPVIPSLFEKLKHIPTLTGLEREVLYLRFGPSPKTLEEIGTEKGFSIDKIRQIENRALERLRYPENLKRLGLESAPTIKIGKKKHHVPAGFPKSRKFKP